MKGTEIFTSYLLPYLLGGRSKILLETEDFEAEISISKKIGPMWHVYIFVKRGGMIKGEWAFFGTIFKTSIFYTSNKSFHFKDELSIGWFAALLKLCIDEVDDERVKVTRTGVKCSRCGRSLTDDISIAYGVGPICRQRPVWGN